MVVRRLKLRADGSVWTVRPSFVLPYGVGRTEVVEKALYLRQLGVPFEALAYVFGRDASYWERLWLVLGRNSVVGTTVKDAAQLPRQLVADQKISWRNGQEVCVTATAGGGCLLGLDLAEEASAVALQAAYGTFKKLHTQRTRYQVAYAHPQAARTSNAVDRLLDATDRLLYARRYLHGARATARRALRALALQWNFYPYSASLRRRDPTRHAPFADLNGFVYHENWLHNLLIAASLGGHRCCPTKPMRSATLSTPIFCNLSSGNDLPPSESHGYEQSKLSYHSPAGIYHSALSVGPRPPEKRGV